MQLPNAQRIIPHLASMEAMFFLTIFPLLAALNLETEVNRSPPT
jgi:hypothetical protein